MKEMSLDMSNSPISANQKQIKMLLKILACLVFMGFAYRIYFSTYFQIPPAIMLSDAHNTSSTPSADLTFSGQVPANDEGANSPGPGQGQSLSLSLSLSRCDIFSGEWVRDPSGPRYTNSSCNTIQHHQNCMTNGRPDSAYIYWTWKPTHCDLPRFNPQLFLHFMTNKSMAFIGDSISRNHLQSLLCLLSQVEQPVEVYHDAEYRSKRWFFGSHNFTLSVIWSPFLTQAKIFEDFDGHASSAVRLHLDKPDNEWVKEFGKLDYVEIAAGKWFLKTAVYYENETIVGCHNCKTENISELGFDYAYRRALQTTLDFITRSDHKVYTLFRTTTPNHFENGEWNTGGYCNRTVPFKEGEIELRDIDTIMRDVELEEFQRVAGDTDPSRNGSTLKLFDTTHLALLRPDGHPGPYRAYHPFEGKDMNAKVQNDCLHWCLPGPIDSWNDLLMNILLQG